jgi:hypothetical protein
MGGYTVAMLAPMSEAGNGWLLLVAAVARPVRRLRS